MIMTGCREACNDAHEPLPFVARAQRLARAVVDCLRLAHEDLAEIAIRS